MNRNVAFGQRPKIVAAFANGDKLNHSRRDRAKAVVVRAAAANRNLLVAYDLAKLLVNVLNLRHDPVVKVVFLAEIFLFFFRLEFFVNAVKLYVADEVALNVVKAVVGGARFHFFSGRKYKRRMR